MSCSGKSHEAERISRQVQFDTRTSQVDSALAELEQKVGNVDGLSIDDREAMLDGIRKLRKDYGEVLQDFLRIRNDERTSGEIDILQLQALDGMGSHNH